MYIIHTYIRIWQGGISGVGFFPVWVLYTHIRTYTYEYSYVRYIRIWQGGISGVDFFLRAGNISIAGAAYAV